MSQLLKPLDFPLYGSRLIEASAGTGKTWTIAALYLRLVLGHGGEAAFARPLLPAEILVMTFTRAATRELSDRIRARLLEAAACFRGKEPAAGDHFLRALIAGCEEGRPRDQAAHRLMLAAEGMDEAAIFTIDAWCQRMLREHAFDSGNLFDEELVPDEAELFDDAVRDYWRQQVYPLADAELSVLLERLPDVDALGQAVYGLVGRAELLAEAPAESLAMLIERAQAARLGALAELKRGWIERADRLQKWLADQLDGNPKCFHGGKLKLDKAVGWFDALRAWAGNPQAQQPDAKAFNDTAWKRLTVGGIGDACSKGVVLTVPAEFDDVSALKHDLDALPALKPELLQHAARTIVRRMDLLKRQARQFGFADMLQRLERALKGSNGATLRERIVAQYPLALVDEFQDTAPIQYRIFDRLYRIADNDPASGLLLIGDPKQSIYGFRGADIHSYLQARRDTAGRHYLLDTNFRSTDQLVDAVNRLFLWAEGQDERPGHARGAFLFRAGEDNPVPFEPVRANGRQERLVSGGSELPALTFWLNPSAGLNSHDYRMQFADHCAEQIVMLLNNPTVGFAQPDGGFIRLKPADIAILVRDRKEAAAIRRALQQRRVASVYLSDKDSVLKSGEADDVLRWLRAVNAPLDGMLARAALATASAGLPLATLIELASDDLAWEQRLDQLKELQRIWQRQGVLAMLRQFLHGLDLPARLLKQPGGERSLTNLLHLAELLQAASLQLDGEQALIRWLAEQIESDSAGGDERILRLESDAELVKVVTVHKSKGLEYPLVFLPFAVSARPVDKLNRHYLELAEAGARRLDFTLAEDNLRKADQARLAEDLRLMYVALTRARHALWLGVAAIAKRAKDSNRLHESALGYLLGGGDLLDMDMVAARLELLKQQCPAIELQAAVPADTRTLLTRVEQLPELRPAPEYRASFEKQWSVGSFTALTKDLPAPHVPLHGSQQKLLEIEVLPGPEWLGQLGAGALPGAASGPVADEAPWHHFPRGALAGNFLHEQLEWLAGQGFAAIEEPNFDTRLAKRCEHCGWGHRQTEVITWLRKLAATPLPPIGAALCELTTHVPEMEFWLPSQGLSAALLDKLCRQYLLDGAVRPPLPERALTGMLKGYADLVFEHDGRYWVLDYKSNALGASDADYHQAALAGGMAGHRYDVQAAIYMLALHRLLKSRLGEQYDPARQFGGAIFLFLRGIGSPGRGCYLVPPSLPLLDALDAMLVGAGQTESAGAEL